MESIENSVIKVMAYKVYKSYAKPGTVIGKGHGTGSGFCTLVPNFKKNSTGDKYIMTNAHCVDSGEYITLRKYRDSKLYRAKVEAISYECDLAILSLVNAKDNKKFYSNMKPLALADVPRKLEKVFVYGYPLGGHNISGVKGSVNRIRIIPYFGVSYSITIQIDAPINFGNSGGPAVNVDGDVVGVAFYGEDDSMTQNMGYIIPTVIIKYFIRRIQKFKEFDRLCSLGLACQTTDNSSLRDYYNIPPYITGVVVNAVDKYGSGDRYIQPGDLLMKINGFSVENDGTVDLHDAIVTSMQREGASETDIIEFESRFSMNERIPYNVIPSLFLPGEKCPVEVYRKGKQKQLKVAVQKQPLLVPLLPYQQAPSYYIVGGLVFVPLTDMFIQEKRIKKEYVYNLVEMGDNRPIEYKDQRVIVLSEILSTEITESYYAENQILETVNGVMPRNMPHFHELITKFLKTDKFLRFDFEDSPDPIILRSDLVKKHTKAIVKNQIGSSKPYVI